MSLTLCFIVLFAGSQTRSSIAGVVVRANAAAGAQNQELPNVQIELKPAGVLATTDPNGKFSFRNVGPGRYTLTPNREGFVLQPDPLKGITPTGMVVNVDTGQSLANIVLPMVPAPVISGYIYHPNGEPLAAAVVQAYVRRYTPYGRQLRIVKRTLTNDAGEYRLFWLNFGEYLVAASYGERALRSGLGGVRLSPNVSKPDDGYTTVFYRTAMNAAQAQAVRVSPGSDAGGVNIVFNDVPRFRVKGRVVSPSAEPPAVRMVFVPEGSDITAERDYSLQTGADGAFEVKGVSPGSYVILASGSRFSSDWIPVSVGNQDIDKLEIPLYPTTTVNGRVFIEGRSRGNLVGPRVSLVRSSREVDQRFERTTGPDGTFTFFDVGPGEYDVLVDRLPPNAYVRSIRFLGRDVLLEKMRVGRDPNASLEIAVGFSSATVEGRVTDRAGQPAAGAQVVLVPAARFRHRVDRYIVGFAEGMGNFQLSAIPPGQYTAFAFEQLEPDAHLAFAYDPGMNLRFADRGVSVNVGETGGTMLQLKSIPAAESAGGFQ